MPRKKGPNKKAMSIADKEVLDHYGQLIRKYREMSDISRVKLCEMVDISNSQLSKWENGGAEPRLHSMIRICEVLNIPLEELLFNVKARRISVDEAKTIKLLRETPESIRRSVFELLGTVNRSVHSKASSIEKEDASNSPETCFLEHSVSFTTHPVDHINNNAVSTPESNTISSPKVKATEKKRGRSPKNIMSSKSTSNESVNSTEIPGKRKRGRPKKTQDIIIEASKDNTPKRKRGRPRKIIEELPVSEVPVKRKRGRPKRSEIESMLSPLINK